MRQQWGRRGKKRLIRSVLSVVLAVCMVLGGAVTFPVSSIQTVKAEGATITSMAYYSAGDGPVLSASGVDSASYGFVSPIFNGGELTWGEAVSDLNVNVKVDGAWVNIDDLSNFAYNYDWGNWNDGGFDGYWFKVSETTYLQFASKTNPNVTLEYTLDFTKLTSATITSMAPTQGPNLTAGVTGGAGFTYPTFNGDAAIKYEQVASDLKVYVWSDETSEWVDIDNNAASGWIYDSNFGQFTDGPGGYWFTVDKTTKVRLASKSTPDVYLDYTIAFEKPERTAYTLSTTQTAYTAAETTGAIGMPLPMIDGGYPVSEELGNFVFEMKVNGNWVALSDAVASGFSYQDNGYNKKSDRNQWGYWVDGIYGLWFQPIQTDMELRIGYPSDGTKGGNIGENYIYYQFIGNPNAVRPDPGVYEDIPVPTLEDPTLEGWNLIFQDEFNAGSLNTTKWNYNTGYYLSNDPGTWGWGNNELEYYTDSTKNTYLTNGKLNFTMYEEPKTFPEIDPNRVAPYSSGKITSKDKFTFKYGRIDFSAKLPTGNGIWPALWMLPNDDTYGTWAASGELDVMEARGRVPGSVCGTIHFGGVWPSNKHLGADYFFPEGQSIDSDFHVYSVVWEENMIKWYVDGTCYSALTSEEWYSLNSSSETAPFDQEFYIIMNLAAGGWFDQERAPEAGDIPATMQVEYVRVYQQEGDTKATYHDNTQSDPAESEVRVTGITLDKSEITLTSEGQTTDITRTIAPSNATNKNVTWKSSNEAVATVSAGQVKAVGNGTAVIMATTNDGGYSATCNVTVEIEGVTEPDPEPTPGGSIVNIRGDETCGLKRKDDTVVFYVNGASFADLHYKVNDGGQINVGMTSDGNGNYSYTVTGLKTGDKLDYFFTYNPGQGALDSQSASFTLPVTSDAGVVVEPTEPTEPSTPVTSGDVAQGKGGSTSGIEGDAFGLTNLTDNNSGTRLATNWADDAWFILDLEKEYSINQIQLNWEGAYGKQYEILVSTDGKTYKSIYKKTNGAGGNETLDFAAVNARYVKFQGIERGLPYGYSLWDMKVIGTEAKAEVYSKISSNCAVNVSSIENGGMAGSNAVDGNLGTRWASAFTDNEWISVDLSYITKVNKVVLNWEAAYGKAYEIQVSSDGNNWTTVSRQNNSDGGVDEITFNTVNARYVRMLGSQRALPYGFSLYEIEVYGVAK